MISAFPENWELINFFEAEPEVLDPDSPWLYNTLEFVSVNGHQEFHAKISPSYGRFHLKYFDNKALLFDLEFHAVDECQISSSHGNQHMLLRFREQAKMNDIVFAVRPTVRLTGGNAAF